MKQGNMQFWPENTPIYDIFQGNTISEWFKEQGTPRTTTHIHIWSKFPVHWYWICELEIGNIDRHEKVHLIVHLP